jgi:2-(1,2-epoxy-1,2-dihydrophenyl)acetyl-CoA isomerase
MRLSDFSTDTQQVKLTRSDAVAVVSFNRPEVMNALDVPTAQAFLAACKSIAADKTTRAVIVRGEGRAFGVGGDLAALRSNPGETAAALIDNMHEGIQILAALDAPVIASLHGMVVGGSMSLALCCDLAIAAQGTRFNLSYANVAASCDVSGSWSLPRLVGLRRAMQIALLSENLDTAEALSFGLINRVVPGDALVEETMAVAQRLANGPTLAYGKMKRLLRQSFDNDFHTQLGAERDAFKASVATEDFAEALSAFFAKRVPAFKGR